MKTFNKNNVAKEKNNAGIYWFYDQNKNCIYVGISKVMKHRLQSYYQVDCFKEHPTKKTLRSKIRYYRVEYTEFYKARRKEEKAKEKYKYNYK